MRIVVSKHNVHLVLTMRQMTKVLSSPTFFTEAHRGVIDAGRKTKTQVQNAVYAQMAIKSKRFVTSNTRGVSNRPRLSYEISAFKGGQRIEMYKGLRALKFGL